MRSVLISTVLFVSSLANAGVPVIDSTQGKYSTAVSTVLDKVKLDPNLRINAVDEASIEVNLPQGTATLTLTVNTCPKNAMCIVGPRPFKITLPITYSGVDSCGIVIVAKRDLRRTDGALQVLTIRDNTHLTCQTFAPVDPTEVVYQTETPGFDSVKETYSTFSGPALK